MTNRIPHLLFTFNGFSLLPHAVLLLLFTPVTAQSASGTYPYVSDIEYNFSLTIILVIVVSAFFFIGFFFVLIGAKCIKTDDTLLNSQPSTIVNNYSSPGLHSSLINSFPVFLYSAVKEHKLGKGTLECAVCITEFQDSDTLRLLPKCDHVFHPNCIDAWLTSHTTCPVCRSNLTLEEFIGGKENIDVSAVNSSDSRSEDTEIYNRVLFNIEGDRQRDVLLKFPRSYSTGHDSLVQPGEYRERYTLRLPEDVRKQIEPLSRTTSCVVVFRTEESSRNGSSEQGSINPVMNNVDRLYLRSDRVGRWSFRTMPSFVARSGSSDPTVGSSKMFTNTVEKGNMVEDSTNRVPV